MISFALTVARKDLLLTFTRGSGLVQGLLLGLLLLFVFSLSQGVGERMSPQGAGAVFWLGSTFCQVLIFNTLYALEEANGARLGLLLAPAPIQAVWLGKALAGLLLLLVAQMFFLPAAVVFLSQEIGALWPVGLGTLLLVDVGMCALGSLLGALSQGGAARESLLSIVLFPLLVPLLLAGIGVAAQVFGAPAPDGPASWIGLAAAFDGMCDRLERSFEAERQFTSDASHELRTPVAVILAECDSLDHGQPTEEDYRQSVDVIRRQGQQMSRLIGQLLHITRLEQGTQKLQLETADLSQLVEVLCEEQAHLAPEGTTLTVHTQPDLLVNGDVTLLSRLLTNLISNAYRYGKPNGHVWVDLRREDQWAVMSVRDDGIGIAPEDRERIFQRFYQVDAARGKDGSGLGLFMVQQAARLHGGSVTVDSRLGEGSTFIVRLPLEN